MFKFMHPDTETSNDGNRLASTLPREQSTLNHGGDMKRALPTHLSLFSPVLGSSIEVDNRRNPSLNVGKVKSPPYNSLVLQAQKVKSGRVPGSQNCYEKRKFLTRLPSANWIDVTCWRSSGSMSKLQEKISIPPVPRSIIE